MGTPTWMYRVIDGEMDARVFDSDSIPAGWHDSHIAAAAAIKTAPESEPVKRRGRPPKER